MQGQALNGLRDEDGELVRRLRIYLDARRVPELEAIGLKSAGGVVTVTGQLSSASSKWLCLNCCRRVAGVRELVDQVRTPK